MEVKGKFYLGRFHDQKSGKTGDQPFLYEPDDLTTHAVVVGMTGSGKTGLCIDLLEEAALQGIPALMIDPKGDITNTLLHFPKLATDDFLPWINAEQARREGKTLPQAAEEAAANWKNGLTEWGIGVDRLNDLQKVVSFAVFTPGSDAGYPVNILASLKAPPISWESNREILREKISGTVTALLGLVGLQDIDPVRSREHILLSNIFEHAWSQSKDLDLGELILQTQSPPFTKLGVFDINTFFPEKERFSLAMLLNNILAAPAFQSWITGQPLEIDGLLFTQQGKPRHSVFYIAHLSDAERMFFVTLLFSAVEAWMRSQPGTSTLKALVYFDEIFGYLPPVSNPPSKMPMLRMLKQARAFGVGLVLVTQNPVDLDYKALSNAGTWFIGKLQTERDKQRLLDGLEGAMSGAIDRATYDLLISKLNKRIFLVHNVHSTPSGKGSPSASMLFQTRWAMNFLAGPLTRQQIPALNRLAESGSEKSDMTPLKETREARVGVTAAVSPQAIEAEVSEITPLGIKKSSAKPGSTTHPVIPTGISEYFLPNNMTVSQAYKLLGRSQPEGAQNAGIVYRPAILAQALVRFLNRRYNLDYEQVTTAMVVTPERKGIIRWENHPSRPVDVNKLDSNPLPQARFLPLEISLPDARHVTALEKDFLDWVFRSSHVNIKANETLKLYSRPDTSTAAFHDLCSEEASNKRDVESKKITFEYDKKLEALQFKLARAERELEEDQTELSQRKMEELGTHAENVLSLFGRRRSSRRLSTSLSKRRLTEGARADVEETKQEIAELKKQIEALEQEKNRTLEDVNSQWGNAAGQVSEITVSPARKDVLLDIFCVAWIPYHLVQVGDAFIELPGYGKM